MTNGLTRFMSGIGEIVRVFDQLRGDAAASARREPACRGPGHVGNSGTRSSEWASTGSKSVPARIELAHAVQEGARDPLKVGFLQVFRAKLTAARQSAERRASSRLATAHINWRRLEPALDLR
jgi:hypothetical protein